MRCKTYVKRIKRIGSLGIRLESGWNQVGISSCHQVVISSSKLSTGLRAPSPWLGHLLALLEGQLRLLQRFPGIRRAYGLDLDWPWMDIDRFDDGWWWLMMQRTRICHVTKGTPRSQTLRPRMAQACSSSSSSSSRTSKACWGDPWGSLEDGWIV
jgi:hypothetical protein